VPGKLPSESSKIFYSSPAESEASRRQFLEIEWWHDPETSLGLANCLATRSNVGGLQWMLVDIALRPAKKSGR
jgi:hypothetical protein